MDKMTKNEMLVILPSRGRPKQAKAFYELYKKN